MNEAVPTAIPAGAAAKIRRILDTRKLSQAWLARGARLPAMYLSRRLRDTDPVPLSEQDIAGISAILGVRQSVLVDDEAWAEWINGGTAVSA